MAEKIVGGWVSKRPEDRLRTVQRVISDLLTMKLIVEREGHFYPTFPSAEPPSLPPGNGQPPDDDDSEGAGMRQLLAHPHLFVLSQKEIEEQIRNAVEVL